MYVQLQLEDWNIKTLERCDLLFWIFWLVLATLFPFHLAVAEIGSQDRVNHLAFLLQKRYENTSDFVASFTQETISPGSPQGIEAKGRVFLKRPSLMRWEYVSPEPQLIVTSDDEVYVYEEEANQVMVIPRNQFLSSELSRAFFFGKGRLSQYFNIGTPKEDWVDQEWTISLVPKSESPQVKRMWITLDPKTHLVREIWIQDQLGTRTHIVFSNISVNIGLSQSLFHFVPPEGVEVYRAGENF